MTRPLPLPVRIAVAVTVTAVALVLRLVLAAGRLGLWLLALAGFHGARLVALAATGVGVWWAAAQVGLQPAVRLAVIGWAAWAVRHHQASIAQHAAVRRLTAALQQHTDALAAAGKARVARLPAPTAGSSRSTSAGRATAARTAPVDRGGLTARPWPQAGQSAEQAVAALGRYAGGFVRRHTPPADPSPWTLRRRRHPR
jgi:hypothetical protein